MKECKQHSELYMSVLPDGTSDLCFRVNLNCAVPGNSRCHALALGFVQVLALGLAMSDSHLGTLRLLLALRAFVIL